MDRNLKNCYVVGGILLACFFAAVICIAVQTSKVEDLEFQLSSEQVLGKAQESYILGLQKRLAESQKRADQAELTLTLITETCEQDRAECNSSCRF